MDLTWDKIERIPSPEGLVTKFVFTKENAVAEAVLYKYPEYSDRTVICCSTQSGCPVGCRFCGAGDYFVRSLTTEEIVSQSVHLLDLIEAEEGTRPEDMDRLQIMFMSMGEPLLNQRRLSEAIHELYAKYPTAALLVSTSAPRAKYEEFFETAVQVPTVGLQFSVHESTDARRDLLVPFKAKLSLEEMAEQGLRFYELTGRRPFFNYCVHEGNNSSDDVRRLAELFTPEVWNATISVVCERDESMRAAHERQEELTSAFMEKMMRAGFDTRRFNPEGQDTVGGGCGQLHYVQDWFRTNPDFARKSVGFGQPQVHADGGFIKLPEVVNT